jgi:hypothetical protein
LGLFKKLGQIYLNSGLYLNMRKIIIWV